MKGGGSRIEIESGYYAFPCFFQTFIEKGELEEKDSG